MERLIDAVNTFQNVSSSFTWIFTSKIMNPVIIKKYELLKDIKTIIAKEIIHIKKRNAVRQGNFSENS